MKKDDFVLAVLAASNGAIHTPVQVQKLFFLLDKNISNRVGGPFFKFQPDAYGPFDRDVYMTLENLQTNEFVCIQKDSKSLYKTYRTSPQGGIMGEKCLSQLDLDVRDYIRDLSAWVRSLTFTELVSTIYKMFPEMKVNSIFRKG